MTEPVVEITLVSTGVVGVSAAHVTVDGERLTVVWPTVPVRYVGGDLVCRSVDESLFTWVASYRPGGPRRWWAVTAHWCETCQLPPGPWAIAELGHLTGGELTDLVCEIADLADEAEDTGVAVRSLADREIVEIAGLIFSGPVS